MSVKRTLVEIAHDEGYGDALLEFINDNLRGKDMLAVRIVTIEKTDQPDQEKPKQFRPFANAAEFEPFRDRWVRRTYNGDLSNKGCFKFHAYDDEGIYDVGKHFSYREIFDDGRQFDDGTPFGIEVTE